MSSNVQHLNILTHSPPAVVKDFADDLIPHLGDITVHHNRTGLVMLSTQDSVQNTTFHLGEALVCEAMVEISGGHRGYAVCLGRDQVFTVAIALIDAALSGQINTQAISDFVQAQAKLLAMADDDLLHQVNATRVEMETF